MYTSLNELKERPRAWRLQLLILQDPYHAMVIGSNSKGAEAAVELPETMVVPSQPTSARGLGRNSVTAVLPEALVIEQGYLSSREGLGGHGEERQSYYIKAADAGISPPPTVSEVLKAPLSTGAGSTTPPLTPVVDTGWKDAIPVCWASSAFSENECLRPTTSAVSDRASLQPTPHFPNDSIADDRDLKAEIMCNYLYQQQLKKMWSNGGSEEGVILKKSRGEYMSCPSDLHLQRNGLFDAVRRLGVQVNSYPRLLLDNADLPVCNDNQHPNDRIDLATGRHSIRPTPEGVANTGLAGCLFPTAMPETPLRCFHSGLCPPRGLGRSAC